MQDLSQMVVSHNQPIAAPASYLLVHLPLPSHGTRSVLKVTVFKIPLSLRTGAAILLIYTPRNIVWNVSSMLEFSAILWEKFRPAKRRTGRLKLYICQIKYNDRAISSA